MKDILRWLLRQHPTSRPEPERFALHSGERQTATTLEQVRFDHVARYELAVCLVNQRYPMHCHGFGLDVFCGTGYGTHMISQRVNCPVLGIDASCEAIALANSHFSGPKTFYCAKVFPFLLPCAAFDFVVCLESIEHVAQGETFLQVLAQSLKPGGLLVVSSPNSACWSLELNPNPFHHCHYAQKELIDLATKDGLFAFAMSYAQDLYHFEAGRIVQPLPPEAMHVRPGADGQVLIMVFTRRG
ncbi:bifunctional 2-polyprenyl-6-hydroxyphenol methylase/3-demethylubiquinol 3-O-methyltransferase UbiG [Accumulibacter sp.]|uniref:class I SAM-dependent methyltransferase n=1 Tax=Accumulibacter sp. TaxID=2053492 RepID=UPI00261D55E6|nr:methyltransferase domain-containing protein [Accumulibacter sp.]MDS4056171.1 methyltransferase domain-containing protein [Accumulibacter sp.]HMW63745.1 methyltransferase domain-containing protein [Accumulibacter sp.]HMX68433.1 methyltransferase domain-containing protein [Accumulibacter sp.]HNB68037.1 methyltransferase domain-containing protein [Accumulibacter sp.]HNC27232.1 methyltransferase domain-containing protein [Accumulibacter sp.]